MGLYKRADSPVWWYSFTINGRRFRGSTGSAVKNTAKAIEAAARTQAALATPVAGRWRISILTGTYLSAHAGHLPSAATTTYQLANINRLIGKDRFVADLSGADVIEYRARRRGEGVGNASINRELQVLRAALNYAHRHYGQPLPGIDWKGLFLKEPPGRTRFLSPAEYARLSAACDDELRTIVLLAVSTGLRRDNIEGLTWEQINLDQGLVHVTVKGGDAHVAKLNAAVIGALARTPPNARKGAVFTEPNRRKRWEAARTAAGLDDIRFHDLRHTFASWARLAGADIADVKEALHHSDISMTMRYAHITPETHRTAFDAVGELFAAGMSREVSRKTGSN
jgi:integrase